MTVSFDAFRPDAIALLTRSTGIDFSGCNFADADTWLCVTGRDDEGAVAGLAAFEFKSRYDAHFSTVIRDRRCLTRRVLRAMFQAVFSRASRVTALVEPHNAGAIRQARRMGFQEEGFMRRAIEGRRDALLFGMLAEDCRYLPREVIDHGFHAQAA